MQGFRSKAQKYGGDSTLLYKEMSSILSSLVYFTRAELDLKIDVWREF